MSATSDGLMLDVVASVGRDIGIAEAVTGGEVELTIDGASTLKLDCHDPNGGLLRDKDLATAIDLKYQNTWWRLVKIAKSGHSLSLTFEDRDVAHLRTHTKPRSTSRGKVTRAQFIHSLVREVKNPVIGFYSPEINEFQPRAKKDKAPEKKKPKKVKEDRGQGIADKANVTVKGPKATPDQIKNGQALLHVADQLGAPQNAAVCLIMTAITESSLGNPTTGMGGRGILQVSDGHPGVDPMDIEQSATGFLKQGYGHDGGAIKLVNEHPDWPLYKVCQAVQISGAGKASDGKANYGPHEDEAKGWVAAHGGMTGKPSGGESKPYTKAYEFSRGQPGKPESSWDAIRRLADEVQWRAFIDHNKLYFISDQRLMRSAPRAVIDEKTAGVNTIDFDFDVGKPATEITIDCRAGLFDIAVGSVIELENMGIANGRFLVSSIRRDLFKPDTTITLVAPQKKLPEPRPETGTRKSGGSTAGKLPDAIEGSPVPGQPPGPTTHDTTGSAGYPARDYFAKGGTPVVAPADGKVAKLSGTDPKQGGSAGGPMGYSIYITGKNGNSYYLTHIDKRSVKVGDEVEWGHQIAVIAVSGAGSWGDGTHCHMGVNVVHGDISTGLRAGEPGR